MPRTLAENATYIAETIKPAIKQAIEDKGVTVPSTDSFLDYADRIGEIEGGGSGYQLKDLPTGSIATVNDAAELPLNALTVSVEAWQEGSGDPSPSNIRPIHGWSEAEININNYPSGYYGMIIHQAISDPTQRIEYTGINANYTPMSQSNGVVSYGDWGSMPTLTLNKPAMIRTDGTFDYWLDETDYNKKADGTASDVDNLNYDGNALAYFPALWMKVIESGTDLEVRFAYNPIDSDYYEVCPAGSEGVWLPMFYGYASGSSAATAKMRSIANTSCLGNTTGNTTTDAQYTSIRNNGNDYYFYGGKLLECITMLQYMWFKTTNSDDICRGNQDGYNASAADGRYGTKSNPVVGGGQFYLTNDGKSANKVLHSLVLATYDVWLRNPYIMTVNGTYYVSKDYAYDTTAAGLTNTGIIAPSQRYIKELQYIPGFGFLPKTTGGSTSTYYCDYFWINASITSLAFCCGRCSLGRLGGLRTLACVNTPGDSVWDGGCALFLKQSKSNTYNHAFTDSQGDPMTCYGAEWNVVDGELKQTDGYIASYNGETLPSTWISDRDVYASGATPTTGAEVVYKLATPTTIPQQAESIRMLEGVNNLYADCGEVIEGEYFVDEGAIDVRKVDYSIGSNTALKISDGRILQGFANMVNYHSRPLDASGNWLDVDWSKDFEIGVAFKFTSFSANQAIFASADANIELVPTILWVASDITGQNQLRVLVSTDGSSWEVACITSFVPTVNTFYFIKMKYESATKKCITQVTSDFINWTVIENDTLSAHPYYNGAGTAIGGRGGSSSWATNNLLIDTFNTYIKGDGVNWGSFTGVFPN